MRAFRVFHTISERVIDLLPVRTWAMRHILSLNLLVMIYSRMSGQEDNHSQIGFFFSNEFSIENIYSYISLEKMQNVYSWKFLFYIKADSKRDLSLISPKSEVKGLMGNEICQKRGNCGLSTRVPICGILQIYRQLRSINELVRL